MNIQKTTQLLRYTLQFIIIYLVLKYANIDTPKSLFVSLVLTSFCVILEFIYNKIMSMDTTEPECNTCAIPQKNTTCHVVCDKVENFTNEPMNTTNQMQQIIPQNVTQPTQQTIQQMTQSSLISLSNQPVQLSPPPQIYNTIPEENKNKLQMHPMSDMVPLPQQQTHTFPTSGTTIEKTPFYLSPGLKSDEKTEKVYDNYNKERGEALKASGLDVNQLTSPYQIPGQKSETNRPMQYNPVADGNIMNEMDYSDFDYNSLPVARGYKTFKEDYGYSFIPPEAWYNQPVRAPICVTTTREPVMPMWANGSPTDVKDFYIASRVTGPQGISTEYINDKLNSGR